METVYTPDPCWHCLAGRDAHGADGVMPSTQGGCACGPGPVCQTSKQDAGRCATTRRHTYEKATILTAKEWVATADLSSGDFDTIWWELADRQTRDRVLILDAPIDEAITEALDAR